ncbi:MAG TPA: hypothetical protein VHO23_01535 [Candidatus Paceibacterota bacterium]|nr:hypothetical protein [Candidatus Paceibacterota bacterium]
MTKRDSNHLGPRTTEAFEERAAEAKSLIERRAERAREFKLKDPVVHEVDGERKPGVVIGFGSAGRVLVRFRVGREQWCDPLNLKK